jgi:hypothetical protein
MAALERTSPTPNASRSAASVNRNDPLDYAVDERCMFHGRLNQASKMLLRFGPGATLNRLSAKGGEEMRRIAVALAFAFSVAAIAAGSAGSATSNSTFLVFVEPTLTAASNGLTLETELEGTFNVADKTASGSGEFALCAGTTEIDSGTFSLTGLVAFQFYGCGEVTEEGETIPLPPDFCGGRAIFTAHAVSATGDERDVLYEVNCQIHDPGGQTPPGTSEGVKANARGVNFNKHVTGDNLFVMLS